MEKQINESIISRDEQNDVDFIWGKLKKCLANDIKYNNIKSNHIYNTLLFADIFNIKTKCVGNINIEYIFYIAKNESQSNAIKNGDKNLSLNCEADYDERKIIIRGIYYQFNKTIDYKNVYISLSHEFHHLYQYQNGFNKIEHQDNLYQKCMNSINSNNQRIRLIGQLIYNTFKHEISSFCVELYQDMINNDKQHKDNIIDIKYISNISSHYKEFQELIDIFEDILNRNKNIDNIIEEYYNINVNTIYRRINKAENYYYNFFKHIIVKYNKYRRQMGNSNNNYDLKFLIETYKKKYPFYDIIKE